MKVETASHEGRVTRILFGREGNGGDGGGGGEGGSQGRVLLWL